MNRIRLIKLSVLVWFFYRTGLFIAFAQPLYGPYPIPGSQNILTNSTAAVRFVSTNNILDVNARNVISAIVNDYTAAGYAPFFVDGLLEHPLFNPTNNYSLLGNRTLSTNGVYISEGFVFNGSNSTLILPLAVSGMTNWTVAITLNRRPLGQGAELFVNPTWLQNYGMEMFSMFNTNNWSEVLMYNSIGGGGCGFSEANKGVGRTQDLTTSSQTNCFNPLLLDGYNESKNYMFATEVIVVSHQGNGLTTVYENCTPSANAASITTTIVNATYSGAGGTVCTDSITTFGMGYITPYWRTNVNTTWSGYPFQVVSSVFVFATNCSPDITNYNNLVATCFRMGVRATLKTKMTLISGDSIMWPARTSGAETRCYTNNPILRYIEQNENRLVMNYSHPGSLPYLITNGNHKMPNNSMPPMNQFKMLPETIVEKELITDDGRNAVDGLMNWQDMVTFFNYMWGPSKTNYGVKISFVTTHQLTNFVDSAEYYHMTNIAMYFSAMRTNAMVDRIISESELINTNWLLTQNVSEDGVHLNGTNQEPNIAFAKLMSGNSTKRTIIGTKSIPSIGYTNWTSQTWQVVVTAANTLTVFDAAGNTIIPATSAAITFTLQPLQYFTATSCTATAYQQPIDTK